jgi:hypothetical protein
LLRVLVKELMTESHTYQLFTAPTALPAEAKDRVAGVIDLGPTGPQVFYVSPDIVPLLGSILKFWPRPLVIPDYVTKYLIQQSQQLELSIEDIELGHEATSLKSSIKQFLDQKSYQALSLLLSSIGAAVTGIQFFDRQQGIRIWIYGSGLVIIEGPTTIVHQRTQQTLEELIKFITAQLAALT